MPARRRETETEAKRAEEPELPQFTAQETAEQNAAYQESSKQIDDMLRQANPGMEATGVITFEHIIQSFYVSAMIAMGAGTEPGQKARVDILGARQSIDMLALLQDKTKGNLTPEGRGDAAECAVRTAHDVSRNHQRHRADRPSVLPMERKSSPSAA